MKVLFLLMSAFWLAGCASDGSARIDMRIPIGENGKYGTALVGIGYLPPERFANVLDTPTLNDK